MKQCTSALSSKVGSLFTSPPQPPSPPHPQPLSRVGEGGERRGGREGLALLYPALKGGAMDI